MHHVGVYFPGKVVRDAVWEGTGGLGTNFGVYISETVVLPLLNRTRKKVALECSHKITPATGMSVYLRLFGRCFYPKCPFGKGNKAEFVINLPMDLSRGKSKLRLPFGQQRGKVRKSQTGEVCSGEEVGSYVWRERAIFWVGRSWAQPVKGDMFQGQEGEILHLVEELDEEVFAAWVVIAVRLPRMACGTREPVALQRLSVCFLQHIPPHSGGYVAGLVTFGLVVVVVIFPLQECLSSRCCSSFPSAFYKQFADKGHLASNLHTYRPFSPAVVKLCCTL